MKRIILLAILINIAIINNAQDIKRNVVRGSSALDMQQHNTQVIIDNKTFDFRILRYYNESDLREMSNTKRSQILYTYTESYKIINVDKCASIVDIDLNKLESQREQNVSKIIEYGNDCKIKIELLSKNEMQQQLAIISNN